MMSQSIINAIVQKAVEERLRQLGPIGTPQRNLRPWTPNNQFSFAAAEEQQPLAILDASSPQSASATWDSASPQAYLSDVTPTKKKATESQQLLRRSSSSLSAASFASFASSRAGISPAGISPAVSSPEDNSDDLNTEDFASCYDEIVPIYKCSKKKLYQSKDKEVVRGPVMTRLDPLELAPFKSRLFRRQPKVGDPNSLKKNADLVFDEFKELVRDIIRELCAQSTSTEPFLDQRYFWCAYDLVRKRRANHVQSWRLYDRPSNFTYGGKNLYEATYGKLKPLPKKSGKRKRAKGRKNRRGGQRKRKSVQKELVFCNHNHCVVEPRSADVPPCMEDESQAADMPPSMEDDEPRAEISLPDTISPPPQNIRRDKSDLMNLDMDDSTTICYSDENDPFSDSFCEELSFETITCERCGCLFDVNNAFCEDLEEQKYCQRCTQLDDLVCVDCVKSLTRETAFPKGNDEWHDGCTTQDVRCEYCYGRFVREQMLPDVNGHLESTPTKKKKGKPTDKPKAKTPCKNCGALTHKTKWSKLCPHNPKYQTESVTDGKVASVNTTADVVASAIITEVASAAPSKVTHTYT